MNAHLPPIGVRVDGFAVDAGFFGVAGDRLMTWN
jgi:hypothetical protein